MLRYLFLCVSNTFFAFESNKVSRSEDYLVKAGEGEVLLPVISEVYWKCCLTRSMACSSDRPPKLTLTKDLLDIYRPTVETLTTLNHDHAAKEDERTT
jgi:hypothetical protein